MNSNVDVITDQSNTTVFVEQGPDVLVDGQNITIINRSANTTTTVIPGPTQVVSLGIQGPIGPQGPAGSGSTITGICGVNIAINTVVISSGGLIYPADPTNITHGNAVVGITTEAKLNGQSITIAQGGEITAAGVSQDAQYFVGLNGVLSSTKIAAGAVWFRYIGLGNAPNSLVVINSASVFLPS